MEVRDFSGIDFYFNSKDEKIFYFKIWKDFDIDGIRLYEKDKSFLYIQIENIDLNKLRKKRNQLAKSFGEKAENKFNHIWTK